MKLCFIAPSNSNHAYKWIKYFVDQGHQITWISAHKSSTDSIPNIHYIELHELTTAQNIIPAILKIRQIIRQGDFDAVHVHSVAAYGLLGLFSGADNIIATPWGSDVIEGKNNFFRKILLKLFLRRAKLLTSDALHMKNELINLGVRGDLVHIINFGIDTVRFAKNKVKKNYREIYGLKSGPIVISTRSFEPVYDIPTLLRAITKVTARKPDVQFIIVGRGSLENQIKQMAKDLSIESVIHFVNFIPNIDLPDLLCSADIYVSTSLSDAGIAASTAEAMSCETPVVISNSGENDKWIAPNQNGLLFPIHDDQTLCDHICRLIDDSGMRLQLAVAGRKTIIERNDYHNEMAKMNQLYLAMKA